MNPHVSYTLLCFGSLFSIVDPFSVVPIFAVLVGQQPRRAQTAVALRAALTCFCVLTVFAAMGHLVLSFFGFTLSAFKVAGGILLFGMALDMLHAKAPATKTSEGERAEAESKADVGLIPVGFPLLSGPGAIAAVMVLAGKGHGWEDRIGVHLTILFVSIISLVVLRSSSVVAKVLGRTGLAVIARVMGLILAALAIQFVLDGLREALPGLTQGGSAALTASWQ
jgi:multiple antibiotic resistance protein